MGQVLFIWVFLLIKMKSQKRDRFKSYPDDNVIQSSNFARENKRRFSNSQFMCRDSLPPIVEGREFKQLNTIYVNARNRLGIDIVKLQFVIQITK